MKTNIFSTLSKSDPVRPENYLTESFVFLLNSLLERDRLTAITILNKLCVNNNQFSFGENEEISITTQEVTEQGRPDIKISSPDKLIYIEVKQDSPLGDRQVERYTEALNASNAKIKHVILLTRFSIEFEEKNKPDKHVLWYEVHNWLSKADILDPVSKYLRDEFNSFLKEKQMTIEKVGWEYINGVPSLVNLLKMIESGIQSINLTFKLKGQANTYLGRYFSGSDYWCGITFGEPLELRFEMEDKSKFDWDILKKYTYGDIYKQGNAYLFTLNLEKCYFFALDKDQQQQKVSDFIKICYNEAEQMRKTNKPIKTTKSKTKRPIGR
jgi:hypothetical protein